MLRKQFNCVLSVFVVILCAISIRCDVSHLVGVESSVDAGTVEVLKHNITDYLVQLASGGGPQMQLQHIYSASKQIVTGTLYTVHAQLTTPEGVQNCEVRVLEKAWIEFCQVRVLCEHGGQYEVTIDPHHTIHDIPQHLPTVNYFPPPTASPAPIFQFQQPVTIRQNPFLNQFPAAQAVTPQVPFTTLPKFDVKPPTQFQFIPQPTPTPAPVFSFKPQIPAKVEFKQPAPAPIFNYNHQIAPKVDIKPPALQFTAPAASVFQPQAPPKFDFKPQAPLPALPALPVAPAFQAQAPPKFDFKPQAPLPALPALPVAPASPAFQAQAPLKFDFKPQAPLPALPAFSVAPAAPAFQPQTASKFEPQPPSQQVSVEVLDGQLNVLPLEKLPKGEALEGYLRQLFRNFMVKYGRKYIGDENEEEYRFTIFVKNFYTMQENIRTDRSAKYSITKFSDFTQSEFNKMKGILPRLEFGNSSSVSSADAPQFSNKIPEKYDQRDENIVTRVKYQQNCAACWAFATVAVIEGLCAKKTKVLQEFSEQSLVDCDKTDFGCKGGSPFNAMKYIHARGGLELDSVYPFEGEQMSCKYQKSNVRVKVARPLDINREEDIAKYLVNHGPVAVNLNAKALMSYSGDVLDPTNEMCPRSKLELDHGVVLIGYGVKIKDSGEKQPYWIAKNHWGADWGEGGFFRIARGKNACGIGASPGTTAILENIPNNCLLNGA